jgi:hypothetical protein
MDLAHSVRKYVLKHLPHDAGDLKIVAALNAMSPQELLVLYINWSDRLVPPAPRQVMTSLAFEKSPIRQERAEVFSKILGDIAQGRDLTPYLSRRVRTGYELPQKSGSKKLSKLKHLDLLLNDWGIHHMHVSATLESDGFVARDGPLIFALFRPDRAYLIDVRTHDDFADEDLIRIIVDTWPSAGLVHQLKGVVGLEQQRSKDDRKLLRSAGIATLVQFGDRVFLPGTGISTAGTSSGASVRCGKILRTLKKFEEHVEADPNQCREWIRQQGGLPGEVLRFEFEVFQNGFGVIEMTSGLPIRLDA